MNAGRTSKAIGALAVVLFSAVAAGQTPSSADEDGTPPQSQAKTYVDNGDGTVTDTKTSLMWEKLSDDGSIHDKDHNYIWRAASLKVRELNTDAFAGHNDWRLPTRSELRSLNLAARDPSSDPIFNRACIDGCTVTTCSCARRVYGSPSSFTYSFSDVCVVDTNHSSDKTHLRSEYCYVRAVRGEP